MDKGKLRQKYKLLAKSYKKDEESIKNINIILRNFITKIHKIENSASDVNNILLYHAIFAEPDIKETADILKKNKNIFAPKVHFRPEKHLTMHNWHDAKIKNKFGILEPSGKPFPLELIDLIIVPALAFDLRGYRLGYGGGFFDRLLQDYKGIKAGIVFQDFLLKEIPNEKHDIKMDFLITEKEIFKI